MNQVKVFSFLFFTGFLLSVASFQADAQQTVTIQPKKPTVGETVTITYHPNSPNAAIQSPDSLKLVFSTNPLSYAGPDSVRMTKTSKGWIAKITLADFSKFGSFYFKSAKKTDKNLNNHQYSFFVYKNGKPVKGGFLRKAETVENRYPQLDEEARSEIAAGIILKELALYPDNFRAKIRLYSYQLHQSAADSTAILAKAHRTIKQRLAKNPGSVETILAVRNAYRQIGEAGQGDSLQHRMAKKYPHSDVAMYQLYQQAMKKKDKNEQMQMLKKYIEADYEQSYINKYYTGVAYQKLFTYYAKKDSLKQMKHIARLWLKPNPRTLDDPRKANDYNDVAEIIAKNGDNYSWAKQLAQKALKLAQTEPVAQRWGLTKYGKRLVYVPDNQIQDLRNERKASILATLGLIYTKQKNYKKAEKTLRKAKGLDNENRDIKSYLAKLYKQTNRPKKAFGIYRDMLMETPLDKDLKKKLKESYIAYNGSKEGYKKQTKAIQQQWHNKMVEKFREEMVNKEAPSLAHAVHLDGTPLDTTKLAGKVVVLDFWATWCGPCNRAFPHMQKVYEKFQDNPNVKFVILDSGWNNTVKKAKEWRDKHDYTLPLYFDHDSKITKAYGVRGIPTTFVLSGDGFIKFKEVGYSGPAMEKTLPLKINMVLNKNSSTAEAKDQMADVKG